MKNFRALLLCSFAFVLLFGLAAQAQTAQLPIRVHVPFAFQAGSATFASGDYQIFIDADRLHIVNIATGERKVFVRTSTTRGKNDPQSAVQFVHKDGKYMLKKVWATGIDVGTELILFN
jgi:hypothetical protein